MVALVVRINPSLTGALPYLAPCQRHQVVMERDDASSCGGCFIFFRTRIDRSGNRVILFMCPHSVGVSSSFPRARGRGPTPYK